MAAMEPLDVRSLVLYDDEDQIVGVKEFHVAQALLEGRQEELGQLLPSQWGMVHLFDLCLQFGHADTALTLAMRGVEGCILEDHHLGPISRYAPRPVGICKCRDWNTCRYCCWAFPVDQGIWMEDWDVGLGRVVGVAQMAAATPITRAMLDLCSRDIQLPFSGSPKAMARLLDIAILTGNQKAAVNLSKKSQVRPLRRWALECASEYCWKAAKTALWAGADFQDLMVKDSWSGEDIPFPQALFLNCKLEDWQEVRHLLPGCHDLRGPRKLHPWCGQFFLGFHEPDGCWKLSVGKIRSADDAGVDLHFFSVAVGRRNDAHSAHITLLDMAIWCGQSDCAEACVDRGIELKGDDRTLTWHKRVLRGESLRLDPPGLDVVPYEAQIAAAAAGRAWLKRSWKSHSSQKGIVLYQMVLKMFKGRSFPMVLVQEILVFSMPVPQIIDQLDLLEHFGDWMAAIWGRPTSVHPAANCNTADVEDAESMQDNGEAGALLYIEFKYCMSKASLLMTAAGSKRGDGSHWRWDHQTSLAVYDEQDKIVGVNESGVKAALEKGLQELGQLLPSQWGMVHLFDICLRFRHVDTAWALALRGVPGCFLEDHHDLGPFCRGSCPGICSCQGWQTCCYCCWTFPVKRGIWMEDWDEYLLGAIQSAQKAAALPLTRAMLDLCSCHGKFPFKGSPMVMARLLDIAILTANQKAAMRLSKKCQLRPLRRWSMGWYSEDCCWEAAGTALWAGANFQDLMVKKKHERGPVENVPFPHALFLQSKLEVWQKVRHLLPQRHGLWKPIRVGCRHGFTFKPAWVTLLDMAIWSGQPHRAEAVVEAGIELKGDDLTLQWHKRVLRGESLHLRDPSLDVVPSEAQTAAAAAGRAWLKRLWKSESSQKGIVLHQMFKGRSSLVQEILMFITPVPKIIDQLDLWEHVGDWMAAICGRPPPWGASSSVALGNGGSRSSGSGPICNETPPERRKVRRQI
eukprot:symbB.v1.2.028640.t1/scaffold2986.1/size65838/3